MNRDQFYQKAISLVQEGILVVTDSGKFTLSDKEQRYALFRLIAVEGYRKYPEIEGMFPKVFFDDIVSGLIESGLIEEKNHRVQLSQAGLEKVYTMWFNDELQK
jgi:hypothetical protein